MVEIEPAPLVDANLLIWSHHRQFPQHEPARRWWGSTLSTVAQVGVPWPVILAFVRVSTHPRALEHPLAVGDAWQVAREWLERPNVWIPVPTDRHATLLGPLLVGAKAGGNHTTDAHLATLAIEWGLELLSGDRGFARFSGLRWRDPLSGD
ncbi:MAG: TA system VapC family ribonuclease toxin [Acidimicrobiales bacterium]